MKVLAIILLILSAIFLVIGVLLVKYRNSCYINRLETMLECVPNILSYSGVWFGIITLFISAITLIYTIREPNIEVSFDTIHGITWEEENGDERLYISQYKDGCLDYYFYQPGKWYIKIENSGDSLAEDIRAVISFDELLFYDQERIYDYQPINHAYGIGGHAALEWRYQEGIKIDEEVTLPQIPMHKTTGWDESKLKTITMRVKVYVDDMKSKENKYIIDVKPADEFMEEVHTCRYQYDEIDIKRIEDEFLELQKEYKGIDITTVINPYQLNLTPYMLAIDKDKLEDYQYIYSYYLNKINSANKTISRDIKNKAIYWGRVKYLCEMTLTENSKDKNVYNIEEMIQNDISVYQE